MDSTPEEFYIINIRLWLTDLISSDFDLIVSSGEDILLEMEREEIEEKCLKQQQIIMDQMKQLKKVIQCGHF